MDRSEFCFGSVPPVMLSLYAFAFGSYGAAIFPEEFCLIWKHVLISIALMAVTGFNFLNVEMIGVAEEWIVDTKDYALAEAARLFLGSLGYLLITLAELFSTLSAESGTALDVRGQLPGSI